MIGMLGEEESRVETEMDVEIEMNEVREEHVNG